MQSETLNLAPAFTLFPSLKSPHKTLLFHQNLVLAITFFAYTSFHASRKPPSIVKSVLGPTLESNSTSLDPSSSPNHTGWPPFNGSKGTYRLGELDLVFLSSYSIGMYLAGHVGDRIDLRLFLVFGMLGSGALTVLFGSGYWLDIHVMSFFMIVQIICGLFQSIGWPSVVAIVGNWFGKSKRGLIMGIWSSNASVGNIIGSIVASGLLEYGWGWSFVVPGILVMFVGILVFFFLIVNPEDVGFDSSVVKEIEMHVELDGVENSQKIESEESKLLETDNSNSVSSGAISFLDAWKLPGVAPYAFSLFFSKLVAYTFLYWLPFYIRHTAVAGVHISHKTAGILSTIFDIGGVFGGILAGFISDMVETRGVISVVFLLLSIPTLVLYRTFGSLSMLTNIILMFLSGLFVNGPYSLITTAVAADLGTQSSIKGNSRALATVSAIIDGTGSVGASLGPLLAGYVSTRGWNSVFAMLIVSICFAVLFLIHIARNEIREKLKIGK